MWIELGRKIMTEFVTLRPITFSYITDVVDKNKKGKKAKGKKSVVIKQEFEAYNRSSSRFRFRSKKQFIY